jgi:hypothetical protein
MSTTIEEIVARGTILSSDGTKFTEEEFKKYILGNKGIDILVSITESKEGTTHALFLPWIESSYPRIPWKNTMEDNDNTIHQEFKKPKPRMGIGDIERRYYEGKCLYYVFGRYESDRGTLYKFEGIFKFNRDGSDDGDFTDIYHEKISELNIPIFKP